MNRNALIIIVLCLAIGAGVYFTRDTGDSAPGTLARRIVDTVTPDTYVTPLPEGSLAERLRPDVVLSLSVVPSEGKGFSDRFLAFTEKLANTSAGKKLNLGAQLPKKGDFQSTIIDSALMGQEPAAQEKIRSLLTTVLEKTKEVTLAVAPIKVNVAQMPLPGMLLGLTMDDADAVSAFRAELDSTVDSAPEGLALSKTEEGKYEFTVSGGAGESVDGYVELLSQHALIGVGSKNQADFLVEAGSGLASTGQFKALTEKLSTSKAFSTTYVNMDEVLSFAKGLLSSNPSLQMATGGGDPMAMIEQSYGFLEAMVVALSLNEPIQANQCASLDMSQPMGKLYSDWISNRGMVPRVSELTFAKFISKNTLLGFAVPGNAIGYSLESLSRNFAQIPQGAGQGQGLAAEQAKEIEQKVAALQATLAKYKLQEIDIIANAQFGPIPDVFIVVQGEELGSSTFVSDFATWVNDAFGDPQMGVTLATTGKDAEGRATATLSLSPQFNLVVKPVAENTVVFAMNDLAVKRIGETLSKGASDYLKQAHSEVINEASDGVSYVGLGAILTMLKPYAGFLSAQQPELALSPGEVDELVGLLNVSLLTTQYSYQNGESNVCAQSKFSLSEPGVS